MTQPQGFPFGATADTKRARRRAAARARAEAAIERSVRSRGKDAKTAAAAAVRIAYNGNSREGKLNLIAYA